MIISLTGKWQEDKERSRNSIMSKFRQRPVKQLQYYDMQVPEGKRFVDLDECLGHRPYLKSHVFQSVVLALYALRCTQHPEIAEDKIWSKGDVPTIVVNVMMIVEQFLEESVDKDPDSSGGFRSWYVRHIQLKNEGCRHDLHPPTPCTEVKLLNNILHVCGIYFSS